MLIRTDSHLHAETILEGAFRAEWEELLGVLGELEAPLRASGPFATTRGGAPKRQRRRRGGQLAYAMFPVDQTALNLRIDTNLRGLGWQRQPFAARSTTGPQMTDLKGDFAKRGIFVEVEFGNQASLYRDLFKFQVAGRSGVGEVGVLVLPVEAVADMMDQGVATYEQALRLLPYMNIGLQLPTVLVGLDLNDWTDIEARYEEMRAVAEANGLTCLPFDRVHRSRSRW